MIPFDFSLIFHFVCYHFPNLPIASLNFALLSVILVKINCSLTENHYSNCIYRPSIVTYCTVTLSQLEDGNTLFDYDVGLNDIVQIIVRAEQPLHDSTNEPSSCEQNSEEKMDTVSVSLFCLWCGDWVGPLLCALMWRQVPIGHF